MRQIALRQLEKIQQQVDGNKPVDDSFLNGGLGLAFYYYHASRVSEEKKFGDRAHEIVEEIFVSLDSGLPRLAGPAFSNGGAGLCYVINFLNREGFLDFEVEAEFEELDRYLFSTAMNQIEADFIDYLHGALGTILYFSERTGEGQVQCYLDALIEKICGKAVKQPSGYWWRNYLLQVSEKEDINFSLSHGLSGILLILLNAYPRCKHKDLIEHVVKEGVRFILKHKIDIDFAENAYSFFPFLIRKDATELIAPNRLAWCYGDLNEVLLFYRAGKLFSDEGLVRLADLIGGQTLLRKKQEMTMISDSHFCHGSSGLAQFYKTLYKESGLPAYLEGYEYWMEQTILLLDTDLEKGVYAGKECDYLEGLIGVGLTLLSYVSERELHWSRSVLL